MPRFLKDCFWVLEEVPKKRSKIDEKDWNEKQEKWMQRLKDWERLGVSVAKLSAQRQATERSLVFSFIEGSLVKAVKKGIKFHYLSIRIRGICFDNFL